MKRQAAMGICVWRGNVSSDPVKGFDEGIAWRAITQKRKGSLATPLHSHNYLSGITSGFKKVFNKRARALWTLVSVRLLTQTLITYSNGVLQPPRFAVLSLSAGVVEEQTSAPVGQTLDRAISRHIHFTRLSQDCGRLPRNLYLRAASRLPVPQAESRHAHQDSAASRRAPP